MIRFNPQALDEAIEASGLTVKDVAAQAGVTPDCIHKLLNGYRGQQPTGATVLCIAKALDKDASAFYTDHTTEVA